MQRKRYLIEVTKNDILQGISCDAESCGIARALKRKFRKIPDVDYYSHSDTLILNIGMIDLKVPLKKDFDKVLKFIQNFDDVDKKKFCRPFKFYVEKD